MSFLKFLRAWLPTFVVVFGLNTLFHTVLAASFFDSQIGFPQGDFRKMYQSDPISIAALEFLITFAMTYFIVSGAKDFISTGRAIFSGAFLAFLTAWSWNLASALLVNNTNWFVWPLSVFIIDVGWRVLVGGLAGFLIAKLWNWKSIDKP